LKLCVTQLVTVLKEVYFLESREYENVPSQALELYSRRDELRKYVINLNQTVYYYNKIRETVLEVEYPLIESQLTDIDRKLLQAENSLTWNSEGTAATQKKRFMWSSKLQFDFDLIAIQLSKVTKVTVTSPTSRSHASLFST